jgi:predicted phage tail protein
MTDLIRGAGGGGGKGGGKQYVPVTAPDGLDSTQYAEVIDLLSEGEIEGLKDGLKSIYINDTPLQNPDSSFNFQNVSVYTRNGTQSQEAIPLATSVTNEVSVGVQVLNAYPVVRSITDPEVDSVRITLSVPQLQQISSMGDVLGASVDVQIAVQYAGGGFTTVINDTITGRTGDLYQRDYLIKLTGNKPVDIRVTRPGIDSTDPKLTDAFNWTAYTEIVEAKLRYPNSALVGMRIDAQQFSSVPKRSYLIRGIKVLIPSNATVDPTTGALIYTGTWNGTFGAAQWCSDPAWILWDLLTASRYGMGDHVQAATLDKWSFYATSLYASALNTRPLGTTNNYHPITGKHGVPDGFGAYEPRFSCNVNIQTAEEAYKLINDMCSVFRAMAYWNAGTLTVSQDKPTDPTYLFTLANVSEEGFSYESSSQKIRPTVAVVSYLDLGRFDPVLNEYIQGSREIAYESVEDQAGIAKYGVVTAQISAFACTSRGQAVRMGKWLLYAEQQEGEVISFTTSVDAGVMVRPGQVIEVADPMRGGSRRGGRITAATTTAVTVDDATGLPLSGGTVSVILPTGAVEQRVMGSRTGDVLTVTPAFSAAPNSNSVWVYQSSDLEASTWRVLAVQEQEYASYLINALAYDASKYDYVEQGEPLQPRDTTNLNELPEPPTNLVLSEALYLYQGQVRAKVIASWKPVVGVNQYQVRWRKDNGNWNTSERQGPDIEILDITPGTFDFEVYSLSATLKLSATKLVGSITSLGKTAPPSDVANLDYTTDPTLGVVLSWDPISDIDADQYEIRRGINWTSAELITQIKATTYKIGYLDNGTYTYLVKAIDTSGVYSTNAASRSVTVAVPGPTTISHVIEGNDLILSWTVPALTSYAIAYYRITYGGSYGTSTELARPQSTSFKLPVTWTGSRTFWVAPVDLIGGFTNPPANRVVTIAQAAAPVITATVSGSTATLNWTAVAGSLPTTSYEIRQGATFATATVLANITGTSYTFRATWSGSATFWVVAQDQNGNFGTQASTALVITAAPVTALSATFSGQNAVFTWPAVKGTLDTDYYLLKRGSTWAAATTVATIYSTAYTLKADWGGTQKFWIAAVDVNGTVGTPDDLDIQVTVPTAPAITQQVVDNNVLLRWNDVTQTLPILSYELRRGTTWAGATVVGTKQGGFTTVFETVSGTYTYWLAGLDSAGNYGTPGSVSAIVSQPPDYALQFDQNSTWAGVETNIYTDPSQVQVVNVNTTETWQSHFTSRSWTTLQDQITAGYSLYIMPTTTTAAYEEEFDYGTVLSGTKVTATLTSNVIAGATTITPTLRVRGTTSTAATYSQTTTTITVTSATHGLLAGDYVFLDFTTGTAPDGTYLVVTAAANTFTVTAPTATTSGNVSWVKWTSYSNVTSVFGTQFRYFRVRYDFASAGGDDVLVLSALNVRLDSKIRNDAGTGTANSADVGGTTVTFNVAFVDVQSISVTPATTGAVIAVYDFVDVPNPTSFKVLLFNTSGTRVSGGFSWSARGI